MPSPTTDRHQFIGEHLAIIQEYDSIQETADVWFLDYPDQPLKKNIHVEVDIHMLLLEAELPTNPVYIRVELCDDYWDQSPHHCGLNVTHMEKRHTLGTK